MLVSDRTSGGENFRQIIEILEKKTDIIGEYNPYTVYDEPSTIS
jgi:hypothetical protein